MNAWMLEQLEIYHKIFRPYILNCVFENGNTTIKFRDYADEYIALFDSKDNLIKLTKG